MGGGGGGERKSSFSHFEVGKTSTNLVANCRSKISAFNRISRDLMKL